MVVDAYRCSPRYSFNLALDHLRVTDLYRFALWTIIYGVRLHNSVVKRGTGASVQLPHLRAWRIHGPPPAYTTSYLPLGFPPLRRLTLGEGAARGWLALLGRLEDGAATTQGITPSFQAKESLEVLNVEDIFCISIDAPSVPMIQCFRNLVGLIVEVYCHDKDKNQRIFKLNNDNVTEFAMALTQLEFLLLGNPCSENTCLTTVACFIRISVHCNKLKILGVHFNTTNIVDDFKNVLEDPQFQQLLRSLPRCSLECLDVHQISLSLDESSFETVVEGIINVFPSLTRCVGLRRRRAKLSEEIWSFRANSK